LTASPTRTAIGAQIFRTRLFQPGSG